MGMGVNERKILSTGEEYKAVDGTVYRRAVTGVVPGLNVPTYTYVRVSPKRGKNEKARRNNQN